MRDLSPARWNGLFAREVETAAPLVAAFHVGGPTAIDYRASFVDGIGGRGVLAEMWPLASRTARLGA